jgi:hypothetical protein
MPEQPSAEDTKPALNATPPKQPTQEELVAAMMVETASGKVDNGRRRPVKRRKVVERKDPSLGGFGIRLAEVHGSENNSSVPRVLVETISRSGKLGTGDRSLFVQYM